MLIISDYIMISQKEGIPLTEDGFRSEWVFLLLIIPVVIYLFGSLKEKYSLIRIIKIVFSNKFSHTIYRNLTPGVQIFQLLLGILSLISISTFILFAELHFDITFFNLEPRVLWLFNLLLILLAIGFRYVVNISVGSLSRTSDAFSEYWFNISRNYKLIGIILMILNFFISYLVTVPDRYIIFFSLIIITIIFLFRIIRLTYIFLRKRFSLFYLILYLCTLEIFPALILIRYLSNQEH
ncbi:MAG: DUF4271 domain-containing protein [Bacteroidota bacterium]|nr:DUF4271 domain-containing protein [Bacteroidota bacterium]